MASNIPNNSNPTSEGESPAPKRLKQGYVMSYLEAKNYAFSVRPLF